MYFLVSTFLGSKDVNGKVVGSSGMHMWLVGEGMVLAESLGDDRKRFGQIG